MPPTFDSPGRSRGQRTVSTCLRSPYESRSSCCLSTTHQSAFKGSERFPISELARIINQVVLRLGVKKRGRFNNKKKRKRRKEEERKKGRRKGRKKGEKEKKRRKKKGGEERRREKEGERDSEGGVYREKGAVRKEKGRDDNYSYISRLLYFSNAQPTE